jgi:hypothetical protein
MAAHALREERRVSASETGIEETDLADVFETVTKASRLTAVKKAAAIPRRRISLIASSVIPLFGKQTTTACPVGGDLRDVGAGAVVGLQVVRIDRPLRRFDGEMSVRRRRGVSLLEVTAIRV